MDTDTTEKAMRMAITTKPGNSVRAALCMSFSTCVCLAALLLCGVSLAAGQEQQGPEQSQFPISSPVVQNIPIGAGDLLDIEVFNTPELSARLRVDQQGQITLPLGGNVTVRGLKVAAAAKAIEDALINQQIMLQPTVMVSIMEYATKGVTVLGEVQSPGMYTLLGPHSLYDALAIAGGPTASEGPTITITHADDSEHPIVVKVTSPNYSAEVKSTTVLPGDTVVVSRAEMVYIVGDVGRSGAFFIPTGQKMTVMTLLSLAQGANRTAKVSRSAVVRELQDGSVQRINFDLSKVMASKEQDLVLHAGDVLVVPRSEVKNLVYSALPGVATGVAVAVTNALANQ